MGNKSMWPVCVVVVLAVVAGCTTAAPYDPADRLPLDWGAGRFTPAVTAVTYGTGSQAVGDLYLPVSGTAKGTIVFLHGGSFVAGDRADLWAYNGPLARQLTRGWAVLNINYSLAPDGPFPAAVNDAASAVRWVRANAVRLGLGPKVVLAGHSAGAVIAADAALGANNTGGPWGPLARVDGWVGIAGLYDLDHPKGNGWAARWLWGAKHPLASPVANLDAADPPGLVLAGREDPIAPLVHVERLLVRAAAVGYRGLQLDLAAPEAPAWCRSHLPMCGVSMTAVDRFFDSVARR